MLPPLFRLVLFSSFGLLFFVLPQDTHGQSADTLIALLKAHSGQDTVRAELLYRLTRELVNGSNISLRHYAGELLQTAEKINSPLYRVRGYMSYGVSYAREGKDLSAALTAYQNAYNIVIQQNGEAWKRREAQVFINIAFIHNIDNNLEQSIYYQKRANDILVAIGDTVVLADNIRSMGLIYAQKGLADSALVFHKEALALYEILNNKKGILTSYGSIGRLLQNKGDYASAKVYFDKYLNGIDSVNNSIQYAGALQYLGELYIATHQWAKAKYYLTLALRSLDQKGTSDFASTHRSLANIYINTGQVDSAFYHLEAYRNAYEERFQLEKSKQIDELEAKFQLSEKEKENELLRQEKELARLHASSYQLALLFLLLVLSIGGYFLWRLRTKNKIIAKQSEQLDLMNQNLQQNNTMLENMMRDKRFLVSLLAHDLRSPLAALQFGIAELTMGPLDLPAETRPVIKSMERSAAQIDEMIHRIIEVEQIENTVRNGRSEQVDLNQVLSNLYKDFLGDVKKRHQKLKWLPMTEECIVGGDPYLLQRIIGNLISNAIKFSPEGKQIVLSLRKRQREAEIQVIDEGPGIDAGEEQFIFQKYYRHMQSGMGKNASMSLGLGLFLVKQYVELHKGSISVSTRPGEGTAFTILFPLT